MTIRRTAINFNS